MRKALLLVAALVSFTVGACATTSTETTTSAADASADTAAVKAEKDRVACRKMCEMAGATEDNASAVADCQAKCDAAGATSP